MHLAREILEKKQQNNLSSFISGKKGHLRIFTRALPAPAVLCCWFCKGAGGSDARTDAFSQMPFLVESHSDVSCAWG